MKIVIANSVGIDQRGLFIIHSPSRWTSGVRSSSRWFAYYPWELAYLSSLLKRELGSTYDIIFIDGCLERWTATAYIEKIAAESPDWLVIESATRVYDENCRVASAIKQRCGAKVIFVGQHATAFPETVLRDGADYVCTGEYEETVCEILKGAETDTIAGLYPNGRRGIIDINRLPWPEDDDVSRLNYGKPGEPSSEYLEIQAYASRGCPGSCLFCVARHVYYDCPNWRPRDIRDIINELKYLKNKYPELEGIFFDEESHLQNKDFALRLADAIRKENLHTLHFEAMCNLSSLDTEVMRALAASGYYKVRFGIETASEKVARNIGKKMEKSVLIKKLEEAQSIGLKTYGTFMMGAPGSNRAEDRKTIDFIQELIKNRLLTNVQISLCTPQPGTPFYDWIVKRNLLVSYANSDFDGEGTAVVSYPDYAAGEIKEMLKYAFAVRDHAFFSQHMVCGGMGSWIKRVCRQHGLPGAVKKGFMRIIREARFLTTRISRWRFRANQKQ
ncbi:MAG: radical SAM protein [Candidatus Omnitrophica bacterium]|nr:radical SAM protein [Candidatus Omnitrophota bacterium]